MIWSAYGNLISPMIFVMVKIYHLCFTSPKIRCPEFTLKEQDFLDLRIPIEFLVNAKTTTVYTKKRQRCKWLILSLCKNTAKQYRKKSLIFLELHVKAYLCTMLFSRAPGEAAVQLSTDQGFVSIYIFLAQICKCYQMP